VANDNKPPKFYSPKTSPFLNSVREAIRVRHLAHSTERSYLRYITDFLLNNSAPDQVAFC
jgi:hypothetical protein